MLVSIPVSVGELIDKITILEIKRVRISDESKLSNIENEYIELIKIRDTVNFPNNVIDLYEELRMVNIFLWETEDKIRIKENNNEFDDNFINLARDVYYTNDKRSKIKNMINIEMGSTLIEEKQYVNYQ